MGNNHGGFSWENPMDFSQGGVPNWGYPNSWIAGWFLEWNIHQSGWFCDETTTEGWRFLGKFGDFISIWVADNITTRTGHGQSGWSPICWSSDHCWSVIHISIVDIHLLWNIHESDFWASSFHPGCTWAGWWFFARPLKNDGLRQCGMIESPLFLGKMPNSWPPNHHQADEGWWWPSSWGLHWCNAMIWDGKMPSILGGKPHDLGDLGHPPFFFAWNTMEVCPLFGLLGFFRELNIGSWTLKMKGFTISFSRVSRVSRAHCGLVMFHIHL